jgi:hypothetical protein
MAGFSIEPEMALLPLQISSKIYPTSCASNGIDLKDLIKKEL